MDWPHQILFTNADKTYLLRLPEQAAEVSRASDPKLPPRLAKLASLVVAGCTDKQIASRTGLSFSTVRTYVRQIYRRVGVHSRVGLLHACKSLRTNPGT